MATRIAAFVVMLGLFAFAPLVSAQGPAVAIGRVPNGGIQPQVQVDRQGVVHLVYLKGDPRQCDVFYLRSEDDGRTWSTPMQVNDQPGAAVAVGTIRGAALALDSDGRPHVAWIASQAAVVGEGVGHVLYTRLNRKTDAFEAVTKVGGSIPNLDGGAGLAIDGEGKVYVVWHAPDKGGRTEADRRVWVARSTDAGESFHEPRIVFGEGVGACACCGLSMLASSNRNLFIVYRAAWEMTQRDAYVLASSDGARSFAPVAVDRWEVGQCVMSTSDLARVNDAVLVAWETRGQIRLGRFAADGKPEGQPRSMPGEGRKRKHPTVAASAQGAYLVAWTEGTGWNRGGSVAWQVFAPDGEPLDGAQGQRDDLPVWGKPAAFARADGGFTILY